MNKVALRDAVYKLAELELAPASSNFAYEQEAELRSTLEDWLWLGLKMGHALRVVA